MKFRIHRLFVAHISATAVLASLFVVTQQSSADENEKTKTVSQTPASAKKESAAETTVKLVIARQKHDQLRVYLNLRSSYINGKSLSAKQITQIADTLALEEAIVTSESYVPKKRIDSIIELLKQTGIKNIRHVVLKRDYAEERAEKLRIIAHRQKSDVLKVYMNFRGLYVNGKSVSHDDLGKLLESTKLTKAAISAEWYLSDKKVTRVEETLSKAGAKEIEAIRKPKSQD